MISRLHETPFAYRFLNLKNGAAITKLPFVVGGATQQGTDHKLDNQNNQDAISVYIESELIIGVICDGCSGTHDYLRNTISNNEVGAKLLAYATCQGVRELALTADTIDSDVFIRSLNKELSQKLISFLSAFTSDDEEQKEIFIFDFMMATILGFVITPEQYFIFGCGDGIVGVNDQITILDEEGSYFASSILPQCCPSKYSLVSDLNCLKLITIGETTGLQNIFLSTDGFSDIVQKYKSELLRLFHNPELTVKENFDYLLADFRNSFLQNEIISKFCAERRWPRDDASFLLLRRTNMISTSDPGRDDSTEKVDFKSDLEMKDDSAN